MAAVGDAEEEVGVEGAWEAVAGISEAAVERGHPWEVLRRSIGQRLRRLVQRHRPHGLTSVAAVPQQETDPPCNRERVRVAGQLLAHVPRHNRGLVPVVEVELDRGKESAPAREPRIVRLQAQERELQIA